METTQANTNANTDTSDDCRQLKNIKFKTMLLASTGGVSPANKTVNSKKANIDLFLEKESNLNKHEPWNKLDKTDKIKQLIEYVEASAATFVLNETEIQECKTYLIESLDKKKLQHVKDVQYDNQTGKILTIPSLHFNTTSRKFTFKRNEKRASTSKSLGSGKKPVKKTADAKTSKVAAESAIVNKVAAESAIASKVAAESAIVNKVAAESAIVSKTT
jgi:hypothetical protein